MEKGIDLQIREYFQKGEVDIRTYSPLTLAYIGDGIFDLVIRSLVVAGGNARVNEMHRRTSHIVKAHTQAEMIEKLLPSLTETESDIYRRGRNAKSPTMAKNATMSDYRKATGFGGSDGLAVSDGDQFDRMLELIKTGIEELGERV